MLRFVLAEDLWRPGARLLIAVSGGPDSMCLLEVLSALATRNGRGEAIAVAHLNHRLREAASDRDAAFVAAQCRARGVPVFIGEASRELASGTNIEARAREQRARFLRRVAGAWGADAICLGHTRDDQAETVLLRLARGGGPGSLAAMRPRRADGIVRPLLERGRAECLAYLSCRGTVWVRDASNANMRHTRNRIRTRILGPAREELGVDLGARLARFAAELRVESELAERVIDGWLGSAPAPGRLPVETVRAAGMASARLLHAWLSRLGRRPRESQVRSLVRVAQGDRAHARVELGEGWVVRRAFDELVLSPVAMEAGALPPPRIEPVILSVPGRVSVGSGWLVEAIEASGPGEPGPEAVPGLRRLPAAGGPAYEIALEGAFLAGRLPLCVRGRRPGDRIRLPGGTRKLSDVLIDAHIPRAERSGLVVVTTSDDMVLWVPGVATMANPHPCGRSGRVVLRASRVDCRSSATMVGVS